MKSQLSWVKVGNAFSYQDWDLSNDTIYVITRVEGGSDTVKVWTVPKVYLGNHVNNFDFIFTDQHKRPSVVFEIKEECNRL